MHFLSLKNLEQLLILAVLCASAVNADEIQQGIDAFNNDDYATALVAWMPLAEDGDLNAMYNIGLIYDEGLGVETDKVRALRWYLAPAEEGDVAAQFNMATIYDFGKGVPENNEKAFYWYAAAARQADEQAQFNLGIMYANGEGVDIDHDDSMK